MAKFPTFQMSGVAGSQGLGLMVLAAALWATVGVADAAMSDSADLSAPVTGFVRTALGALALASVACLLRVPCRTNDAKAPFPLGAAFCFGLCCAAFQVMLFLAFRHEGAGIAITVTVTVCLPPLLSALGAALCHGCLPGRPLVMAIVLAVGGVAALEFGQVGQAGVSLDVTGAALLLGASLAFCGLTLASRRMTRQIPSLWAAATGLAMTAGLLLALSLASAPDQLLPLVRLGTGDLALLAYVGLAATGGAYLAFASGLRLAATATSALVATMTEPVFATLLAAVVVGEKLASPQMAGILFLVAAMVPLSVPRDSSRVRPSRDLTRSSINAAPRGAGTMTIPVSSLVLVASRGLQRIQT